MPELSRRVPLGSVAAPRTERIVATAAEREALADRFGILAVDALEATLDLMPEADGGVRVTGGLVATVVQECVVTFEPVAQGIAEPIAWRLLPAGRTPADGPDDPDEIETDGTADLGDAVAEQLGLALDPLPRAPEAAVPTLDRDTPAAGPFAALNRLRRGDA